MIRTALAALVIGGITSLASPTSATEPADIASEAAPSADVAAIQSAISEALRLSSGRCGGRAQDCGPQPPCDARGRRLSGENCTLVWKKEDGRPEFLTWVENWEVTGMTYSHTLRLPVIGQDGKLY